MTAQKKMRDLVALHWVPEETEDRQWQLRIRRDFRDPKQVELANKAWEELSGFTELLECKVPNENNLVTWDVVLGFMHRTVWLYTLRGGRQSALFTILKKYVKVPIQLTLDIKRWWGKRPRKTRECVSWESKFNLYVAFKREKSREPQRGEKYRCIKINAWCIEQRKRKKRGTLSCDRIRRLSDAKFPWSVFDLRWETMFALYVQFKRVKEREPEQREPHFEKSIGAWCGKQREYKRFGKLSCDRIRRLTAAGFPWDPLESQWETMFALYVQFKSVKGREPKYRELYLGKKIGGWCSNQKPLKRKKSATPSERDRIRRLSDAKFSWSVFDLRWETMFALYVQFKRLKGREPEDRELYHGKRLGRWCSAQRKLKHRKDTTLSGYYDRIRRLTAAGFPWDPLESQWETMFALYVQFKSVKGREPICNEVYRGKELGTWSYVQRRRERHGKLSRDRIRRLTAAGFPWDPLESQWETMFALYVQFKSVKGREPNRYELYEGKLLESWCCNQRQRRRIGKLSNGRIRKLTSVGFSWNLREQRWERMLALYVRFKRKKKREPYHNELYKGKKLEQWCYIQRRSNKHGTLSREYIRELTAVGFPWKFHPITRAKGALFPRTLRRKERNGHGQNKRQSRGVRTVARKARGTRAISSNVWKVAGINVTVTFDGQRQ